MISLDPTWTIRLTAWAIRLWRFLRDNFTRSNPQAIRLDVHDKTMRSGLRTLIDKVKDDIDSARTETSRADRQQAHPELKRKGDLYWYLAELYWGKSSDRSRFASAWFYVLAGECHEIFAPRAAGQLFHWAAHEFRGLHSYERAIEFYERAGDLLKGENDDLAIRSLTRAVSVCNLIGDSKRASEIQSKL